MKIISNLRRVRELSQIELALSSGVPRYIIQLWEQGIRLPSPEQIASIAEALGVQPGDLISAKYQSSNGGLQK